MAQVTIYHNPRCSRSRETLELLRDKGHDPKVVLYLQTAPDMETLRSLLKKLGKEPADLIRPRDYNSLKLPQTNDSERLLRLMVQHPSIIERPIVVAGDKARLGRPPKQVLEIL